jgi:hypothetical protein
LVRKRSADVRGAPVVLEQPGGHVAGDARHLDVQDHGVRHVAEHQLHRLDPVLALDDREPLALQHR